jgi:hypothetical protein
MSGMQGRPSYPPLSPTSIRCVGCGYDLTGTALGASCPECGTLVATTLQSQSGGERSCSSATTCFVLGLLSLAVCALLGPIAILVYFNARSELNRGGYSKSSHTLARVGLILAIISTSLISLYAMLAIGFGILG